MPPTPDTRLIDGSDMIPEGGRQESFAGKSEHALFRFEVDRLQDELNGTPSETVDTAAVEIIR